MLRGVAFLMLAWFAVLGGVGGLPTARAADELELARKLVDEAEPFSKRAGNPELSPTERKKARRQAYTRLIEARGLYDAWLDAHPGQEESMDAEYCRMASMLFWVKKLASANEFGTPKRKLSGRKPKPKSETTDAPPPTAGPEAEPTKEARARQRWDQLLALERSNPGDVPTLHAAYEQFLADFSDPTLTEYAPAVKRLGELAERMKSVFKQAMGSDPEAHPDMKKKLDSENALAVVAVLSRDLKSKAPETRLRATELLGQLGSGAGSYALATMLRDSEAEIERVARQGLIVIGGDRAGRNLVSLYIKSPKSERQHAALGVIAGIAHKSDVDAWAMTHHLGRFVLSKFDPVSDEAIGVLSSLGRAGGPGLVDGLVTRGVERKVRIIDAIAETEYHEAAHDLGGYLLLGDKNGNIVAYREAALRTLRAMGPRCVPYLIPRLKSKRHRDWVASSLRDITHESYTEKDVMKWRAWWAKWESGHPEKGD